MPTPVVRENVDPAVAGKPVRTPRVARASPRPWMTLTVTCLWLILALASTVPFASAPKSAPPVAQVIAIRGKAVYGTDLEA